MSVERSALSVERSGAAGPRSASAADADNPWPGLATFTEDQSGLFYGRDEEIRDLARRAERNALTVLFGQSGLGKSSLLQAGVFPRLRAAGYWPVYIRLDHGPGAPPPAEQVKALVQADTARAGAWTQPGSAQPGESLWEFFHHRDDRLVSSGGKTIVPVLVFDQFEELFTLGAGTGAERARAVAFMSELAELVENRPSEKLVARLEESSDEMDAFDFSRTDYRVVITLREDFLPHLETLKTIMPALMENRMRLARMTGTQALDAVVKPGGALVTEEVARAIVEFVAGAKGGSIERLAELDVEPPLLSVICRELNERRRALGQTQITADLVSGNRREILTDFYERSVADLPAPMRAFVEDHLLTKSGFRDNLALETALEFPGVTRPRLDTLVARRLLRIEDRLGVQRVELTHDVLAEVIRAARDERQQDLQLAAIARQARHQRWVIGGLATTVVVLCIAGVFGLHQRRLTLERMSRTDVGIASRFLDDGKTADGLAYLLRAARHDPTNPVIAPRLASVLTSRNFLLPEGAPLQLGSRIYGSLFSPDGQRLAVLCEDGTIAVVNMTTGEVARSKLPSPPRSQGNWVFSSTLVGGLCQDGIVRVLDRATGRVVREIHFDKKAQVARGPWGNIPNPTLFIWFADQSVGAVDISSGRVRMLPLHNSTLFYAWSKDGHWFAHSEEPRREVQVWDTLTGERRALLSLDLVGQFGFSPDGTRLATLSRGDNNTLLLRLWSLPGCEPVAQPQIVQNGIGSQPSASVNFSPDSRLLLVGGIQGAQVYETATAAKVGPYVSGAALGAGFTPDGRRFLIGSGAEGLQLRDATTGQQTTPPMVQPGGFRRPSFSEDGGVLLTTSADGFARLWDTATGQLLAEPTLQQSIDFDASISPDGSQLVIGTIGGAVYRLRVGRGVARPLWLPRSSPPLPVPFLSSAPSRLLWLGGSGARVLDAVSGRDVAGGFAYPAPLAGFDGQRRGFAIRPDGGAMVGLTTAGLWQAWMLGPAGVTHATVLENAPAGSGAVRFSPAGDLVAIVPAAENRTVRIWNLHTGKIVGAPLEYDAPIPTGNLNPTGFSPDGRRFAAGSINGVVEVREVATGKPLMRLAPMRDVTVTGVEFSPDGSRIATANGWGEVQLWDASTGAPAGPIIYHAGRDAAMFSPDGRFLLTYSGDGTARVWDGHTAAPVSEPAMNDGAIRSAAFSPDGRRFVTASQFTTARVWDTLTGQPLTEPLPHPSRLFEATFSPDGRFILTEHASVPGGFSLWSVPPPSDGAPVPPWLLDLATICASKTVDDDGQFVDASAAVAKIDDVRRTLAALPDDAPYAEWGRWFLADRATRPIAPGFTITPAEADKLAASMAPPTDAAPATPAPAPQAVAPTSKP